MYKINDKVIYKRDVCVITDIKEKLYNNKDYYVISPITDKSLTINIPTDNILIKDILTRKEALDIIDNIFKVKVIDSNDKNLEPIYKELLNNDDILDLVRIIKTTYLRNRARLDSGKKIGDKDDMYFNKAENYLYTILSVSLDKTPSECKKMIIDRLKDE